MKKLNLEKLLLIFIILLPILDISSFLFRNFFKTNISISTFIRPIIPITIMAIIFFKNKFKLKTIIIGCIYAIYSIIHLLIFIKLKTIMSYGSVINEMQYLVNYSFTILNLFIYYFIFNKKNNDNLKKAILYTNGIYLFTIFLSIVTKTYSTTYLEGIGIKGWFESGNSISAILILNLFITFLFLNKKNIKLMILSIIEIITSGIYLIFLLGTRTGLYGFVIVIACFVFSKIFNLIKNAILNKERNIISKKKKIILIICSVAIIGIFIFVGIKGSSLLKRRKYLAEIEGNIVDNETGTTSHVTGAVLEMKQNIENGTSKYSEAEQKSIIDLYNYANKKQFKNTDRRSQQLIYNFYLVKNQKNILYILFGNGFVIHFGELILEMEIPAFLFNFGIIGLILYFIPFFALFIFYIYYGIKNIKKIDDEFIFLLCGIFMSFALSLLLGRLFFNSSAMVIISVINAIIISKINEYKNS